MRLDSRLTSSLINHGRSNAAIISGAEPKVILDRTHGQPDMHRSASISPIWTSTASICSSRHPYVRRNTRRPIQGASAARRQTHPSKAIDVPERIVNHGKYPVCRFRHRLLQIRPNSQRRFTIQVRAGAAEASFNVMEGLDSTPRLPDSAEM